MESRLVKKILNWAGAMVFSLVVAITALEVLLSMTVHHYECDTQLGWRFVPDRTAWKISRTLEFANRVSFNSHGFRDIERSYKKPPETYRILLLGDSFLAATQVPLEESFSALLEQRLVGRTLPDHKIEIITTGVDGYGTAQQLLLFRGHAWRYEPDLVLSEILVNDIADNSPAGGGANHYMAGSCGRPYFELDRGTLELANGGKPRSNTTSWDRLLRSSTLYANIVPIPTGDPESQFNQWQIYDPVAGPLVEQAWQLTEALILELSRELASRGIRSAHLMIPEIFQVDMSAASERSLDSRELGTLGPYFRTTAFLEERRLPRIDLLPPLQKTADLGERPYFEQDPHWNAKGHEVAAATVYDWLVENCSELAVPLKDCGPK